MPFSSSSDRETEERGRFADGGLGRWLGARGRPWSGGKERGKGEGPIPCAALAEVDRGDSATVVGGGDRGGAIAELGGISELGEKHEGALGIRFPRSPSAMAACRWIPTAAGGARRLWWWRRRWRARGGLCGGGASCGGGGWRWGPFIGAEGGGGVERGGGRPAGSAERL